jgi:hypothetical protein
MLGLRIVVNISGVLSTVSVFKRALLGSTDGETTEMACSGGVLKSIRGMVSNTKDAAHTHFRIQMEIRSETHTIPVKSQ